MNVRRTTAAIALMAALPLGLAACGSNSSTGSTGAAAASSSAATTPSETMTSTSSDAMASKPFGAGCSAVPADGAGSFNGMATAPVATAASANPVLSTLVTAVKAAGLVDTLNSAPAITVFAPANSAFEKVPAADLKGLLADKAALTKVLTYHVIAGKLTPEQLAGTHKTLNGGEVTVTGSGEAFQVGAGKANVVCGNVQTANATVYILDSVLMPPAA
ncbi:MAG: fasciclin domain-containing protein [Actinomycetota bacterium]|nr:fasciclin domain-containing protein [Actinomycetota bacterium]